MRRFPLLKAQKPARHGVTNGGPLGGRNAVQIGGILPVLFRQIVSTSDFQSEIGEVFGEIGGELPGEVWKEIFELLLLGKIVRSMFHQNSTANFTIKLHYEVLGCGGP